MSNGNYLTLFTTSIGDRIVKHDDVYSLQAAVLSSARANKYNKLEQKPAEDNEGGPKECKFCHPEKLIGRPKLESLCGGKVVAIENAAPYLHADQKVFFLYHEDEAVRERAFHKYKAEDLGRDELFYFLSGAIEKGKKFAKIKSKHCHPKPWCLE